MSTRHVETERLHDLLDGLLTPAEESQLRAELDTRPELAREYRAMAATFALLGTPSDVEPPADLCASVMRRVQADGARKSRWQLPAWCEKALVVSGAAGIASLATIAVSAASNAAEWAARLAVEGARGLALVKGVANDLGHLDWMLRLVATVGRASATVLESFAEPLIGLTLVGLLVTTVLGAALLRGGRSFRSGGFDHAHLLA